MRSLFTPSLLVLFAIAAGADAAPRDVPYCQILDRVDRPAWDVLGESVSSARVDTPGGHNYSMYDVQGGGGLLFSEAPGGRVELAGAYALYAFDGQGGIGLPDSVADLHLDASYVWRNWDGRSLRLTAQPGFRGEWAAWSGSAFRVPFEVVGVQALSPRLSGQLGVALYPGYTRTLDPRFGVRYALSETWSVDAQYPESRVQWRSPAGAEAYLLIRNDPINEFWLEEDDPRRTFRFEESRLAAGWVGPLGASLRVRVELGYVFNRAVDYARAEPARSVDDAVVLGVGLGGAL